MVVANGKTYSVLTGSPDAAWTEDIGTMVTAVRQGGLTASTGPIDPQKLALLGHSAGAKNAFRALAQLPSTANTIIALDVSGQNVPMVSSLSLPVLLLGERNNTTSILGQACAPAAQNFDAYYAALPSGGPVQSVNFLKASHVSWLDSQSCATCFLCASPSNADHGGVRRLSRRYLTAWLERTLRGDATMDTQLTGAPIQADVTGGAITFQRK